MVDLVLELIDFNEGVDYSVVSKIVIVYLILLWVFVSIWVFNDARYRFNNSIIAFFLAVLNLFLSFPFLLIYLLIRPSHREEWDDLNEEGGVNIPVVNFTGKDGVVISLQLKIDSKKILDENIDYKLDVTLNKEDETVSPGRVEISNEPLAKESEVKKSNKIKRFFSRLASPFRRGGHAMKFKVAGFKARVKQRKENNRNHVQNQKQTENQAGNENTSEQTTEDTLKNKRKKNKSKKKKRK